MKTTSYKISKKLAEIGFEGDADYYYEKDKLEENDKWNITELQFEGTDNYYPAYDLETILDALPKERNLLTDFNHYLKIVFENFEKREKAFIGYWDEEFYHSDFLVEQEETESLADTAARLLILLHEKGIVDFK